MNIYFSGIGGVGIGPLAEIAHDAGYTIQGSDRQLGTMTEKLQARGITISDIQDGSFLKSYHQNSPIDWLVHSAALPADHPELQTARELGIKTSKRDELIATIIADKNLKLIAVAGTHGKTTTTGMMVWALKQLGIPVSYSIGTTLSWGPSGLFDPGSEYFVYECDEFDRNFLHFSPYLSLITSIDYDHPDTYPTKDSYLKAFDQFIDQSSHAIMWNADSSQLTTDHKNSWVLGNDEVIDVTLAGQHNRRNATLVAKALEYLNLQSATGHAALASFPGTDRRFERLSDNLYSDYGHHPTEIAATLQMAREVSDHIVLVYQPHQNIRQHELKDLYTDCFEKAETVYWLPTYLSREDPNLEILQPQELTANITNHTAVTIADFGDELWDNIQTARANGKLVLVMGAGEVDLWLRQRLTA